ncbi:MAG: peptidase M14 [Bacteroidetes bacterium]|nr:MAG: peptidase M14 [Bacteroidota bacterium]
MLNRLTFIIFFIFTTGIFIADAENSWLTWYEKHEHNSTPSYEETMAFSRQLADSSPIIHYEVFGSSHQNRDLGVLIVNKQENFAPGNVHDSEHLVVLVQASIHPGEPVGKDAGLQLLRDIAIHGKHLEYLDNITLLFIPILNADGHERFGPYNRINQDGPEEMGWRTNARNLNLNRDYLKADSEEMQALLKLWHHWEPDFFIDTHSTNGGDYQYTMTYAMDIFGGADPGLMGWINENYLPHMEKSMEADNYPIFPYVTYRSWHDPRSGLQSRVGHPMFSNSYASELNRPGLLLETHMLKPYPKRVESTYLMIVNTLHFLHQDKKLREVISKADEYTASEAFRQEKFPLRWELTSDSVIVDFLGVEYTKKKSTLSGGNWFIYEPDKPVTYQIPWFNQNKPAYSVMLPEAYVVPVEYAEIIERLQLHGIEMTILEENRTIPVETYRFRDVQLASRSNEGRQTAAFTTELIHQEREYLKGSAVIPMNQSRARLIAHALEPMAPGSFVYWGFFNAVFERVEYFESYVMETMAREMLASDPSLRQGLDNALKENPSMANNPYAILSWFYEQTPYYDQKHNIYPVGRILKND